jgi:LuxR family maltose regulon positive regulatory protein
LQAAAQRRLGSVIEIGALRALALAAVETHQDAVGALAETLTLAAPQRHIRVFADEGKPMATLLGRLVTAQRDDPAAACVPLGYLADLQRAFAGEADTVAPVALPGMVEPLTGREREVLMLVADGKSNHAIARELVVTVDTVKKHVSHVLLKLGASNRTEAAARGRELRLID